jgi:mercuric ion transport protein
MTTPDPTPPDRPPTSHSGQGGWTAMGATATAVGATALAVLCCAAPVLIAAGALGALGAVLLNPVLLTAAGIVLAAAVTWVIVRRGHPTRGDDPGCPPNPASPSAGESRRLRGGHPR